MPIHTHTVTLFNDTTLTHIDTLSMTLHGHTNTNIHLHFHSTLSHNNTNSFHGNYYVPNQLSKPLEIRFVLLLLLRDELSHSDQDQTRSGLDRIRHDQGFPNSSRKMACWGWIFRDEFGKSGQDQTQSGLAGWGGFSVTNLGNLDRIRHNRGLP